MKQAHKRYWERKEAARTAQQPEQEADKHDCI